MTKRAYVVGFAFYGNSVALIRKNRPAWQAGRLNGVGGKIEMHEIPLVAMIREFEEETGVSIERWTRVLDMHFDDSIVYVFAARLSQEEAGCVKTVTDEPVAFYHQIGWGEAIENIPSLIELSKQALAKENWSE